MKIRGCAKLIILALIQPFVQTTGWGTVNIAKFGTEVASGDDKNVIVEDHYLPGADTSSRSSYCAKFEDVEQAEPVIVEIDIGSVDDITTLYIMGSQYSDEF